MTTVHLENVEDIYVLTPMQQGMIYHTLAESSSGAYVNQIVTRIDDPFEPSIFEASWARLVERHTTLRTGFLWDGLDEPLQIVRARVDIPWEHIDLSSESRAARNQLLEDHVRVDRDDGFDLAAAPLMRMTILESGEEHRHWIWTFHHLIVDGWSAQVLLRELDEIYRARGSDDSLPPAMPFSEFIAWSRRQDESELEEFWSIRLRGFTSPHRLDVPGLHPEPESHGHETLSSTIESETSDLLRATAGDLGVTVNAMVAAAWGLVLSRWHRTSDVVFGMTVSGRPAEMVEIDRAVGLFINTIPLRIELDGDESARSVAHHTQGEQLAALNRQQASLAAIQRWSDIEPGEPLFESILVYENYPDGPTDRRSIAMADMRHIEQSNYPLAVLVVPREVIELHFVYDTTRLSSDAVQSLSNQLVIAIDSMARDPESRIGEIRLKPHDGPTDAPSNRDPQESGRPEPIHRVIEKVASARPEQPALVSENETVSYRDVDHRANALAGRIVDSGAGPGTLVGLMMPRSPEMVVGILGILKAGAAYVPLDSEYPAEHLRGMIDRDGIGVVVADKTHAGLEGVTKVLLLDVLDQSPEPPRVDIKPESMAYMIHTSGSTGSPKGVLVSHANLHYSTMVRYAHYGEGPDRFLLLSSYSFDSSIVGIFWTLASGGMLILPKPGAEHDLDRVLELARRHEATHLLCLPTLYELMVNNSDRQLDTLRVAIVAGEACPPSVVRSHYRTLPEVELHNEYGPTETTVWCTVHRVSPDDADGPVPIGRPIPGVDALIVDEFGNRVPDGFPGTLIVGGPGVAIGYHGVVGGTVGGFEKRTVNGESSRFYDTGDLVARRPDGALLFLGRVDSQVKVRGHRVEVPAVEAVARQCAGVEAAAIAARPAQRGEGHQLVGYLVTDPGTSGDDVRRQFAELVPSFMVPDVLVTVDEIPLLPNGKVDYQRLTEVDLPTREPDRHRAPRDEIEGQLAAIWSELLGIADIGLDDDYFALGGDSILSIQMISRARQVGIELEPAQVARSRTVAEMAAAVRPSTPAGHEPRPPLLGIVPLGPIQRWFFDLNLDEPSQWNQARLIELKDSPDVAALKVAVDTCVERHDMLRARFVGCGDGLEQIVPPFHGEWLNEAHASTEVDVSQIIEATQASLSLESGPLVSFLLIRSEKGQWLLIVAHHLVVDVVSWALLLGDLTTAYEQARSGSEVDLLPRSESFGAWVEQLSAVDWAEDVAFWREQLGTASNGSVDYGIEGNRSSIALKLSPTETDLLLTRSNDAYRTRPIELLVAALASSEADRNQCNDVALTLEGHGRDLDSGIDVSRTIGWFTAMYPVRFSLPESGDYPGLIAAVKERYREVPRQGLGFGILKFMDSVPELGAPMPAMSFNYLGKASAGPHLTALGPVTAVETSARAEANQRPHDIEVVAWVNEDGELEVRWHFGAETHETEDMRKAAESLITSLRSLVAHTLEEGVGSLTPSDFPEAGMSQDELEEFMEGLE